MAAETVPSPTTIRERWRVFVSRVRRKLRVVRAAYEERLIDRPTLVRILFPEATDDQIRQFQAILPERGPINAQDLRGLLSSVDRLHNVSPVTMRARREDLRKVELEEFSIWIDNLDGAVSLTLLEDAEYEQNLTDILSHFLRPSMTFVDVGANIGYFALLGATRVGPEGHVHAIEASSENAKLLLVSLMENQLANVTVYPYAATDTAGWAHFSSHTGSNGGLLSADPASLIDQPGDIVPCATLDDLLLGVPVDVIKLDVEGSEGLVLKGASKLLDACQPIITSEISFEMLERVSGMTGREYLENILGRGYHGYVIHKSTPTLLTHFETAEQLCAHWPGHLHLGDLLFVPESRVDEVAVFAPRPLSSTTFATD